MSIFVKSIEQKSPSQYYFVNGAAVAGLLLMVCFFSQPAYAIKKCKDADGKWHYGDVAVRECENSKITTLSNKGTIKEQKAAPKTAEQLAGEEARRVEREKEAQRKKNEELEKARILSVYETEGDIDRQRDNQLYSVDSNIAVHNTYLESLQNLIAHEKKKMEVAKSTALKQNYEDKIKEAESNYKIYSDEVITLKSQREKIIEKFDKEKLVYRELTKQVDKEK